MDLASRSFAAALLFVGTLTTAALAPRSHARTTPFPPKPPSPSELALRDAVTDLKSADAKARARGERNLRQLAKHDPEAQFALGLAAFRGQGVPKDHREAVSLYKKAAHGGSLKARHMLSILYREGCGVKKDADLGLKLLAETRSRAVGADLAAIEEVEAAGKFRLWCPGSTTAGPEIQRRPPR